MTGLADGNPSTRPDVSALADTIREALWQGSETAKLGEEALDQLLALLNAHHAVGALEGALIGDECPVCKRQEREGDGSQSAASVHG